MLINARVNPMELNEAIVSECIMVHFFLVSGRSTSSLKTSFQKSS